MVFPTMCAICLGPYRDAVSIPCGHIFCEECLPFDVTQCPKCRRPFRDGILRHTAIRKVFIDFDHMQVDSSTEWPPKQRPGILFLLKIVVLFVVLLYLLRLNQQVNDLRKTCWCGTPWNFLKRLWAW
ncbi:hypothetical protein CPB85DRAFT_371400 [Mucidula mucida]|nr:hypothetical protein CPB85DRAFT_371400 [Mucidula mucida]